ncbi:MAG: M6 family metalloprotease domain-containing protein [Candidatus Hydrogenedentes bacterium]|nr:M6 family metalloprotease domain-containing protein [Candidatus Hydrogenedentota bacterium]
MKKEVLLKREVFYTLLLALVFSFHPLFTHAIPAPPYIYELSQPDGSTFMAKRWGDEFCKGWETVGGYTIVFNEDTGFWEYAILGEEGELKPSTVSVKVGDSEALEHSKRLRPTKRNFVREVPSSAKNRILTGKSLTGEGKMPVVLMNFADRNYKYSRQQFTQSWFGSGSSSRTLKKYYEEVSNGNFTVSPGSSGIVGWYRALNGHDYYGANQSGIDYRIGEFIKEAAQQADRNMNFSEYDQDGDGEVDIFIVVFQGTGEHESGNEYDIWPHQFSLDGLAMYDLPGGGKYMTQEGVYVNSYLVVNEVGIYGDFSPIGVIAHEYGHALGLPDLYDTDYSSMGVGDWSLMASGSYGEVAYPGDCPLHLDAWSKFLLGWIQPVEISLGSSQNITLSPVETGGNVYKIGTGNTLSGEYFLVENRQKIGFDAPLPTSGLCIWHIDGDLIKKRFSNNSVNNRECVIEKAEEISCCSREHFGVSLEQADGKFDLEIGTNTGDSGDLFPGSTNKTSFKDSTTPSSLFYGCKRSWLSITEIVISSSNIQAIFTYEKKSTNPNVDDDDEEGCGKSNKDDRDIGKHLLDIALAGVTLILLTGLVGRVKS